MDTCITHERRLLTGAATTESQTKECATRITYMYLFCDDNVQVDVSMDEVSILVPADCALDSH